MIDLKDFGQLLADNLNYNVFIESLANGESLTPSEIIKLFKLSRDRNSDNEKDIKKSRPTL